jgi:hypothetical protein
MILFIILMIILAVMAFEMLIGAIAFGGSALFIFADAIIFVAIVVSIIRYFIKRKKGGS